MVLATARTTRTAFSLLWVSIYESCVNLYVHVYVHLYVHVRVCVHMRVCMCLFVCVCVRILLCSVHVWMGGGVSLVKRIVCGGFAHV